MTLKHCDLCGGTLSPWPEEDGSQRCMSCGQLQRPDDETRKDMP